MISKTQAYNKHILSDKVTFCFAGKGHAATLKYLCLILVVFDHQLWQFTKMHTCI